jgi:hypothetical protein
MKSKSLILIFRANFNVLNNNRIMKEGFENISNTQSLILSMKF